MDRARPISLATYAAMPSGGRCPLEDALRGQLCGVLFKHGSECFFAAVFFMFFPPRVRSVGTPQATRNPDLFSFSRWA